MASRLRDLTYAFRRISKSPGIAVAAIVSIGLGIAANATIFSIVSTFVLRPAPVGDPSTLLALHMQSRGDRCCNQYTWPLYLDVRDQAKSFSGVAAYYELLSASMSGEGNSEPERIWGQCATTNFFDVAQLRMPLGRGFLPAEEKQQVIVLGYSLWQHRFAADPAIIGKSITFSGHPFTVVGIAPLGFRGVDQLLAPEFWVPLGNVEQLAANLQDRNSRYYHWLGAIGRVKPGVTQAQVRSELDTLAANLAKAYPASDKDNSLPFDQAGSLPRVKKQLCSSSSERSASSFCLSSASRQPTLPTCSLPRPRDASVRWPSALPLGPLAVSSCGRS